MAERKKTTKRLTKAQKESAKEEAIARNKRKRHIYSIVLFAIGLLLTAFSLAAGESAWYAVHTFLRGIFGLSVFATGPMVIYASIMIARDKRKTAVIIKIIQLSAIILLVSGAVQIIGVGDEGLKIGEVYEDGKNLRGGGVIGMVLSVPLLSWFKRLGASIIVLLIAFVFIMLMGNITLDSFLRFIAKPFKKAGKYAKEQREQYKNDAKLLEESRQESRKKIAEEETYMRMKEAERNITNEIENKKSLPPLYVPEFEGYSPDEAADSAEAESSAQADPPYSSKNTGESGDTDYDEPPFDIETANPDNPVQQAIENFQKEESDEAAAREARENSFSEPKTEPKPVSDFDEIEAFAEHQRKYSLPGIELLDDVIKKRPDSEIQEELDANSTKLVDTLKSFGVMTKIVGVVRGPSVTRYEIQPAPGVKISKITSLTDDIALNLAAAGVRMEAPIPGKSAVGVEVPNHTVDAVNIRELIDSGDFRETDSNLGAVIGKAISGEIIISDIAKMPHLLIAGTTGSGKSVCVNSIIMSILYRATPEEVRLIMIDPKLVEFGIYSGIPHLLTPVVTDPKKAAGALKWAVGEMTQRYALFAENNVRDIGGYNEVVREKADKNGNNGNNENNNGEPELEPMAKIVIFIDELADLMMTAAREVEESICRLAQLARAAGIHLVIATQRPTVNVVTGLIKANIPSRIALKVASQVDSRTIIDTAGADKLLGKGDMLYFPVGIPKPVRVQGCWVSVKEIERVVKFTQDSFDFKYDENVIEEIERQALAVAEKDGKGDDSADDFDMNDDKLEDAIEAVINAGKASTSYLQLKLQIGYGRAARMMEVMERMGVIGKPVAGSSKAREVLMSHEDWLERKLLKP